MDTSLSPQTTSPQPPPAPQLIGVGDLLNQAWQLLMARFRSFVNLVLLELLLSATVLAIAAAGVFWVKAFPHQYGYWAVFGAAAIAALVYIYYIFLRVQISLMYVFLAPQNPTFTEALSWSQGKILPYFGLALLSGMVLLGATLLLLVPGLILAVGLSFALWVYVAEGEKGWAALQQSRRYAHGRWWGIVGRNFLLTLIIGAISGVLRPIGGKSPEAQIIISVLWGLLSGGYSLSFGYLLYKSAAQTHNPSYQPKQWVLTTSFIISLVALASGVGAGLWALYSHFLK